MSRALALTLAIAAIVAQAATAAADEYTFSGSDGTDCRIWTTRSSTPETGGTYRIDWRGWIVCDHEMGQIILNSDLHALPDQHWYSGPFDAYCVNGRLTCYANTTMSSGGSVGGLPAGTYRQSVFARLSLLDPSAVWRRTPFLRHQRSGADLNCLPGSKVVTCTFDELFTVG